MTKEITITGYSFDELDGRAKERAVNNYIEHWINYGWWEFAIGDFIEDMAQYGIDIAEKDVHFSGFWSQGDGAAFSMSMGSSDTVKYLKATGQTKKYWSLYLNLIRDNVDFSFWVKESWHGFFMQGDHDLSIYSDYANDNTAVYDKLENQAKDLTEDILEFCQDKASDLYHRLEKEYEHLCSEDQIRESYEINEVMFNQYGRII